MASAVVGFSSTSFSSSISAHKLHPKHVGPVYCACKRVARDWKALASCLQISETTIKGINPKELRNEYRCLAIVLEDWLSSDDPNKSWRMIHQRICTSGCRDNNVELASLADAISTQHQCGCTLCIGNIMTNCKQESREVAVSIASKFYDEIYEQLDMAALNDIMKYMHNEDVLTIQDIERITHSRGNEIERLFTLLESTLSSNVYALKVFATALKNHKCTKNIGNAILLQYHDKENLPKLSHVASIKSWDPACEAFKCMKDELDKLCENTIVHLQSQKLEVVKSLISFKFLEFANELEDCDSSEAIVRNLIRPQLSLIQIHYLQEIYDLFELPKKGLKKYARTIERVCVTLELKRTYGLMLTDLLVHVSKCESLIITLNINSEMYKLQDLDDLLKILVKKYHKEMKVVVLYEDSTIIDELGDFVAVQCYAHCNKLPLIVEEIKRNSQLQTIDPIIWKIEAADSIIFTRGTESALMISQNLEPAKDTDVNDESDIRSVLSFHHYSTVNLVHKNISEFQIVSHDAFGECKEFNQYEPRETIPDKAEMMDEVYGCFEGCLKQKGLVCDDLCFKCEDDEILQRIAAKFNSWEDTALYLGFKPSEIRDISNGCSNEQSCRLTVLQKWSQGDEATYFNLLIALQQAEDTELICYILNQLKERKIKALSGLKEDDMIFFCGCAKQCSLNDFCSQGCPNPYEKRAYPFPRTFSSIEQKLEYFKKHKKDITDIMEDYRFMICEVERAFRQHLGDNLASVNQLKGFILAQQFLIFIEEESKEELLDELFGAETIADIFRILENNFVSWFNHHLLGSITNSFGIGKESYNCYVNTTLAKFLQQLLFDMPRNCFMSEEHGDDRFKCLTKAGQIILKIKLPPSKICIKGTDLLPLRHHIAQSLGITFQSFNICSYGKSGNCLQLTVSGPSKLVKAIFPLSSETLSALGKISGGLKIITVEHDHIEQSVPEFEVISPSSDDARIRSGCYSSTLSSIHDSFAHLLIKFYCLDSDIVLRILSQFSVFSKHTKQSLFSQGFLRKICSHGALMKNLNPLLSFVNFRLLGIVLLDDAVATGRQEEIYRELSEYRRRIESLKLTEVPQLLHPSDDLIILELFCSDKLEVEYQPEAIQTMQDLFNIQNILAFVYKLKAHAFILHSINLEEHELKFFVALSAEESIMETDHTPLLDNKKISCIWFQDKLLYEVTDETLTDSTEESVQEETLETVLQVQNVACSSGKTLTSTVIIVTEGNINSEVSWYESARQNYARISHACDGKDAWKCNYSKRLENERHTLQSGKAYEILEADLSEHGYKEKFYHLLWQEEKEHQSILDNKCNRCDYELVIHKKATRNHVGIACIQGMDRNQSQYASQASEALYLIDPETKQRICRVKPCEGNYHSLNKNFMIEIAHKDAGRLRNKYEVKKEYLIGAEFELKHSYFNSLHRAVICIPDFIIPKLLPSLKSVNISSPITNFDYKVQTECCHNSLSIDSVDQLEALKAIVNYPPTVPIILTGPFGTGKTRVLTRAALEFASIGTSKNLKTRILMCAHHFNTLISYQTLLSSALITSELPKVKVIRIIREKDWLHDEPENSNQLPKASNILEMTFYHFQQNIQKFQKELCIVIITTYMTSLKISQVLKSCNRMFTHILLDEAAQVREPEAISSLCAASPSTKIVLAGDNKQVCPDVVVLGRTARDYGLNVSLLERLERHYEEVGAPLSQFVLRLGMNYRCNCVLTSLLSRTIYCHDIACSADTQKFFPHPANPWFPCVFHCCNPEEEMEQEANSVVEQVEKYFTEIPISEGWKDCNYHDICIVSASRSQLNLIKAKKKGEKRIRYLPSYNIQGHEFQAIFVCTLEHLDRNGTSSNPTKSLVNPRVFNTVLCCSKSLVVAVGNPFALLDLEMKSHHPNKCWNKYLELCLRNNSVTYDSEIPDVLHYKNRLCNRVGINPSSILQPTPPSEAITATK